MGVLVHELTRVKVGVVYVLGTQAIKGDCRKMRLGGLYGDRLHSSVEIPREWGKDLPKNRMKSPS